MSNKKKKPQDKTVNKNEETFLGFNDVNNIFFEDLFVEKDKNND